MFYARSRRGCGGAGYYAIWATPGRGFGGHRRSGGDGEGRRRRMFDSGELRLVLLKLIADTPRHGYDLIREIEELTGGAYAPSPGVVYPTLTLLDDMGLIDEVRAEGSKKLFAIAEPGTAELAEKAEQVTALFAKLRALGETREKTDGAPIRRAMGNLRSVLQDRLTRDDADSELLYEVAALIDEAARRIERLKG